MKKTGPLKGTKRVSKTKSTRGEIRSKRSAEDEQIERNTGRGSRDGTEKDPMGERGCATQTKTKFYREWDQKQDRIMKQNEGKEEQKTEKTSRSQVKDRDEKKRGMERS